MGQFLLLVHNGQFLLPPSDFFLPPSLLFLKSLSIKQLCIPQSFKLRLVFLHGLQLFFLQHFHPRLLKRLPDYHLEDRFNFDVKLEQVSVPDLGFNVDAVLAGHEPGRRRPVDVEVSLHVDRAVWRFVVEFEWFEDGVVAADAVDADVLAALHGFGRALALFLLLLLHLPRAFGLGRVHVVARVFHVGDYHGCLGVASHYSAVPHDVLGFFFRVILKWVSLFGFCVYYFWLCLHLV